MTVELDAPRSNGINATRLTIHTPSEATATPGRPPATAAKRSASCRQTSGAARATTRPSTPTCPPVSSQPSASTTPGHARREDQQPTEHPGGDAWHRSRLGDQRDAGAEPRPAQPEDGDEHGVGQREPAEGVAAQCMRDQGNRQDVGQAGQALVDERERAAPPGRATVDLRHGRDLVALRRNDSRLEDLGVGRLELRADRRDAEARRDQLAPRPAHPGPPAGVGEQGLEGRGRGLAVPVREDQSAPAALDVGRQTAGAHADDRHARGHGLQQHHREGVGVGGQDQHVSPGQPGDRLTHRQRSRRSAPEPATGAPRWRFGPPAAPPRPHRPGRSPRRPRAHRPDGRSRRRRAAACARGGAPGRAPRGWRARCSRRTPPVLDQAGRQHHSAAGAAATPARAGRVRRRPGRGR